MGSNFDSCHITVPGFSFGGVERDPSHDTLVKIRRNNLSGAFLNIFVIYPDPDFNHDTTAKDQDPGSDHD